MKVLRYILLGLLVAVLILVVVGAVVITNVTRSPLPQQEGTLTVDGLSAPVEILRDAYGVPHIYATTSYDLFFAQGYTHAQDRWWQMAFARAIGSGRLQEITGSEGLLSNDLFIRTIGWRRTAQREYDEIYDEETKSYLNAFADGVNAYIGNRANGSLAFEYSLLGVTGVNITVEPWTPVDSIVWGKVMAWDLSGQLEDFEYQSWADVFTPEQVEDLNPSYPFDVMPTIVTADDLPIGEKAPIPAGEASDNTSNTVSLSREAYRLAGNVSPDIRFAFGEGDGIGSNNWVVAGSRTDTGLPLLANDPHLGIQMPSIWYEVGLHCQPVSADCPFDVRGFAFAPAPGVVIGHNDRIAWGFTNVGPDVMDLYSIKVNPDNPLQYEYDGEMRDMIVHQEVIRRGETTYTIEVRETHLGPIINDNGVGEDGEPLGFNAEPVAVRWTALDTTQLFTSIVKLNSAQNFADFREALSYFSGPSQNMLYADVDGNIGYQTPGLIPVRAGNNAGNRVLDGSTSETAWLGYIPYDLLPRIYNPERGWIHSANQALVVPEYYDQLRAELAEVYGDDINPTINLYWDYGYRGSRIVDLIEANETHSIDSFKAMQSDNLSGGFEAFKPFFAELDLEAGSSAADARDRLMAWDMQSTADSAEAAIWAATWREIVELTFNDTLAANDLPPTGVGTRSIWGVTRLLDQPDNAWWDDEATADVTEQRDDTLRLALERGLANLTERLGDDVNAWRWGNLHVANFVSNPLGASGIELVENAVNRSVATAGSLDTVNAASWSLETFAMRSGASFRMIADLSDWDASLNMNTTGQSGHPFSDHYADLIPLWSTFQYKPMLFGREAVEAASVRRMTLQP